MEKFWLIFKYEYLRHVRRKRFILTVLSMPLMMILVLAIGAIAAVAGTETRPAGYIDQAGVILRELPEPEGDSIMSTDLMPFADEAAARAALEAKEIQAYFVIPSDYAETNIVRQVSLEAVESDADNRLRELLRYNLLSDYPDAVIDRILAGPLVEVQSTDAGQKASENNILTLILPLITGVLFMIVINTSGGYLLQAVSEEKENRTMEIVVTSVSPMQLMAGKSAGNLCVGLTQLAVWLGMGALGLLFAVKNLPFAQGLSMSPAFFWLTGVTFLPAFIMVAALMAMLGATTTEASEAQQWAGMISLPFFIPYWFMALIIENPNGPVAIGLSLFPLTAATTLPLRAALTTVPLWQSILGVALLMLVAAGSVWLAGKAFRMGMLRYGKHMKLKEIFRKA